MTGNVAATAAATAGVVPVSKGVLRPEELARHVAFDECAPTPAVARWVERIWSVAWDLPPGLEHVSSVVPHPSINLTVERGAGRRDGATGPGVWVTGVVTRRFDVSCHRDGGAIGVKFHPGGFAALTGHAAADLTDRVLAATDLLPGAADLAGLSGSAREAAPVLCAYVGSFAAQHPAGPATDHAYDAVTAIVRDLSDPSLTRVDDLAERAGLSVRGLQRLLRRYVGVGPKWLLVRRRLHDAVAELDAGYDGSLADLAAELGWYDQNQFTRDFTALVGTPPGAYRDRPRPS